MTFPSLLQFCPLEKSQAVALLSWRYPAPYDVYNMPEADPQQAVANLLRAELNYVGVLDERNEMIAFRCFGRDAQVPAGDYSEDALDLGGGLRPDLTGHGLGRHVIAAAMNYAWERFRPRFFRATVACFNMRAKRTCARLGYRVASTFTRAYDGLDFDILMQEARVTALSIPLIEAGSDRG
jgi:ribosomal-protein-alanine N-acetyltransferase